MTQEDWAERFTGRIAKEIERRRTHAPSGKLSAQWLSDRTHELGHRVGRSRISDLETGRRKRMDITELIVLAEALEVAPVELMFPGLPDGEVEYLPGRTTRALDALKNFTGEGSPAWGERDHHLALMRSVDNHRDEASRLEASAAKADSEKSAQIESQLSNIHKLIEYFRYTLIEAGYTVSGPPPKPPATFFGPEVHQLFREEDDNNA